MTKSLSREVLKELGIEKDWNAKTDKEKLDALKGVLQRVKKEQNEGLLLKLTAVFTNLYDFDIHDPNQDPELERYLHRLMHQYQELYDQMYGGQPSGGGGWWCWCC